MGSGVWSFTEQGGGEYVEMLFKCSGEIGKIFESAGNGCRRYADATFNLSPGFGAANQIHGINHRHAGKRFEFSGKMILTDANMGRDIVQRYGFRHVPPDIGDGFFDPFAGYGSGNGFLLHGMIGT